MNRLASLALILAVAIAPLAMYQLIWGLNSDIVSIAKAWVIIAAGVMGIASFPTLHVKVQPLLIATPLLILTSLSSVLSPHPDLVLRGAPLQSEGLMVLASYYVLFVVASATMANARIWLVVTQALAVSVLMVTFIGYTEEIERAVLLHPWLQWLMGVDPHTPLRLEAGFPVSATLGNPNHLGTYAALVGPFFLGLSMYTKDKLLPYLIAIPFGCAGLLLIWSESLGGFAGFIVGSAFVLVGRLWKTEH